METHIETNAASPALSALTARQKNEIAYHRDHARQYAHLLNTDVDTEVITSDQRRWWNPYWSAWTELRNRRVAGLRALVVGCGFGEDAILLARLGARVSAFDISAESIDIASHRAKRADLEIDFQQMQAEHLAYADDTFDIILAVDILHHVDIPDTMAELSRVAHRGAYLICEEIFTHSVLDRIRHSAVVDRLVYPRLVKHLYGTDRPYITPDERKLNQDDVHLIESAMVHPRVDWFYCVTNRLIPDRYFLPARLDRMFMRLLGDHGSYLGGRVLIRGELRTPLRLHA